MELPADVALDLALLSAALDVPGVDLGDTVRALATATRSAVSSYQGFTISVGDDFTVSVMEGSAPITSSMLIPLLRQRPDADPGAALILYAAAPGAFVDLSADLIWLTGEDPADYLVDAHLGGPPTSVPAGGLQARGQLQQAIGVLIGRGATPDEAYAALDARAAASGFDRIRTAEAILAETSVGDPTAR